MRLLGLAGEAGAGKDYTYLWIKDHRAGPTHRLAFADGVRAELRDTFKMPGHVLVKPYSAEERAIQQWWGTEYRREQDEDYWVHYAMEMLAVLQFGYSDVGNLLVVFTDVRFANEVKAIEERDGLSRLVLARRETRTKRLGKLPPRHASEEMDFETGGTIMNDADGSAPVFDKGLAQWMEIDEGWVIDPATGQIVAYAAE